MKDVIKSYFFSITRTKMLIEIFIIILLCNVIMTTSNLFFEEVFSVSEDFVDYAKIQGFLIFCWSCVVIGWLGKDIEDKTMFLEIATGKSRSQVLFGRFIVALTYSILGSIILYASSFIIGVPIWGFGDYCTVSSVIIKGFLIIPIIIYFDAIALLITVIMKSRVSIGITFYGAFISILLAESPNFSKSDLLPFFSYAKIMNYKKYSIYTLTNMHMVDIYDSTIMLMPALRTVIISLVLAAAFIVVSYHFFKKIDF